LVWFGKEKNEPGCPSQKCGEILWEPDIQNGCRLPSWKLTF